MVKFPEILTFLAIHLFTPALGVVVFFILCRRMMESKIVSPPFSQMFLLFFNLGGVLLVLLTGLFWEWSGMASFGFFYLALISPVLAGAVVWTLWKKKNLSNWHKTIFYLNFFYGAFMVVATGVWLDIWYFASAPIR